MKKKISIIATFRNEEKCINEFIARIKKSFIKFNKVDYKIIFVDDFSNDLSNTLIKKAKKNNKRIKLITLKKRYGHNSSVQTGFDFVNNNNYAVVIDCDLQDRPELIAQNFSKIKSNQTIHFVRKKREDPPFQRFYTKIAYYVLFFISGSKIIRDTGYFKILPPSVVKKVKKNTEISPYWNYLFTKHSKINKVVYYVKKRRMYGSSKFNIMSLNPWLSFFSGIHFFRERFITIISSLLFISIILLYISFYNFYNILLSLLFIFFISFLILNLTICKFVDSYKKRNKRIYCKYK